MAAWQPENAEAFLGKDGLIDTHRLLDATAEAERLARLDSQHEGIPVSDPRFHMPFSDPATAREVLPQLGVAFHLLQAEPGHRVLDLGCGHGWLARLLAQQGLEVQAVDPSATAIGKAKAFVSVHLPQLAARLKTGVLEKGGIPLPDASVDRIIAFHSLHRLGDLAGLLPEMQRVLAEGGRAVIVTAAPGQSRSPAVQARMRATGIAEPETDPSGIQAAAAAAGFARCEFALAARHPVMMGATAYAAELERVSRRDAPDAAPSPAMMTQGLAELDAWLRHDCCIVLSRTGEAPDSREIPPLTKRKAPIAEIAVLSGTATKQKLSLTVAIRNLGGYRWRPGGTGAGGVNLGVMRRLADGTLERDFRRVRLSAQEIMPGETVQIVFELPLQDAQGWSMDLVAEGVSWFGAEIALDRTGTALAPKAG